MKKLKILYIDIEGGYGGSSRSLFNMVSNLNNKLFEPVVICKKKGPTTEKLTKMNINFYVESKIVSIIPLPKKNLRNILVNGYKLFFMKRLIHKIASINPDIVHLNYEGLVPLHYLLTKKIKKFKTILHFRSSIIKNNFFYKQYGKYINNNIDYLIFITENQYNLAKKAGILVNKIPYSVLYNASYMTLKKSERKTFSTKTLKIIYLGTIDPGRGIDRLLDLANSFNEIGLNVKIEIYGQDYLKRYFFIFKKSYSSYIRKKIKKNGLESIIRIRGFTSNPEEKLRKADLLIHPSKNNDPWGRNIIEAMTLGVPVISHGKYNKFVQNNVTGILMNEWNLNNYVEAIKNIYYNRKKLNTFSKNSLKLSRKIFDKKSYQKKLKKIYTSFKKE